MPSAHHGRLALNIGILAALAFGCSGQAQTNTCTTASVAGTAGTDPCAAASGGSSTGSNRAGGLPPSSGGTDATGGAPDTGGVAAVGGTISTGGAATGGSATGGSATGGQSSIPPGACAVDADCNTTSSNIAHCVSGTCTCWSATALYCDGQCPEVGSDANNCGACGHVCPTTAPACNSGSCACYNPPCGGAGTGGASSTGGAPATGGALATGGSKATGGAPATGGSKATGTTSVSACGVNPVSPNATQQTKNLLCYLYSQYKNHVLTGQQEANWNANPTDVATIYSDTGKYPAVLGSDFLYRDSSSCTAVTSSTTRAIAYWNAGGITMFRYHMGMPGSGLTCSSDCYQGANCAEPTTHPTSAFFTNVITAGTAENTSLNAKLDYVAVQIAAMKAANVPIILAIYHETQANGWFWWAIADSGAQFIALWKYTFNYLTVTKGLNNIVWLMPFSGSPSAAYYPGSTYVDIGGPDQYTTPSNLLTFNASGNWSGASSVFGSTMPITMHETGSAIQPGSAIPSYPWLLFNVWATYETNSTYNTPASLTQAYNNTYAVTRDKIPSLK